MCMDISNTMNWVYYVLYAKLPKVLEHHGWHHLHSARVLVLIVRRKFGNSSKRKPLMMWWISTHPDSKSQTVFTRHHSNEGTRVFTKILRWKLKQKVTNEGIFRKLKCKVNSLRQIFWWWGKQFGNLKQ